ncbi:MAG: hypothetical protein ACLT4C_04255 [Butyricicoccus sp.]
MSRSTAWVCTRDADWNGWRITLDVAVTSSPSVTAKTIDHAADGGWRRHGKQRAVHPRSSGRYTGSNTENGVAQAIHRHILGNNDVAVAIGELPVISPQQRGCTDEVVQFERIAGGAPANGNRSGASRRQSDDFAGGRGRIGTHILKRCTQTKDSNGVPHRTGEYRAGVCFT